jgi:hypothetical protein
LKPDEEIYLGGTQSLVPNHHSQSNQNNIFLSDFTHFEELPPRNAEEKYMYVLARDVKGNKSNNRFKCRYCGKIFTGGAQRIRVHLTGVREGTQQIERCPNPSPEAIKEFGGREPTPARPTKKRKSIQLKNNDSSDAVADGNLINHENRVAYVRKMDLLTAKFKQDALQSAIDSPMFATLSQEKQIAMKDAWFRIAMGQEDLCGADIDISELSGMHPVNV